MDETRAAKQTINQLVSTFGFPLLRSREAVAAIGNKTDVQMAYNWLLDHGEEDNGGPIEVKTCHHADEEHAHFINVGKDGSSASLTAEALKHLKCVEGCASGEVWMCLCCGDVRCSRYVNSHNMAHFQKTRSEEEGALTIAEAATGRTALGHFAAIGLRDLSVWCYHCSAYVTNPHFERIKRQMEKIKFGNAHDVPMEDDVDGVQPAVGKGDVMRDVPWQSMHGFKGDSEWLPPTIAAFCEEEARPGYATKQAHEYLDDPETLKAKVSLLASWIRQARDPIVYTGAGISTAAGVDDYASIAKDSIALEGKTKKSKKQKKICPMEAEPTLSHCVITQLHYAGLMPHWIQQNHDGLPQKAGFPQQHINEIHGAWFDPSNEVVQMSGELREDLYKWLLEWEEKTDLCIAVGSSLCGMEADRVVESAARRAQRPSRRAKKQGRKDFGSVIISLQQTRLDDSASLRIFAKSDDVFEMLASDLGVPTTPCKVEDDILPKDDIFKGLPYRKKTGEQCDFMKLTLNLRVGSSVKVINQPLWDRQSYGNTATVVGKTSDGDYLLDFSGMETRTLGRWWLIHAMKGEVPFLPVVNN